MQTTFVVFCPICRRTHIIQSPISRFYYFCRNCESFFEITPGQSPKLIDLNNIHNPIPIQIGKGVPSPLTNN